MIGAKGEQAHKQIGQSDRCARAVGGLFLYSVRLSSRLRGESLRADLRLCHGSVREPQERMRGRGSDAGRRGNDGESRTDRVRTFSYGALVQPMGSILD